MQEGVGVISKFGPLSLQSPLIITASQTNKNRSRGQFLSCLSGQGEPVSLRKGLECVGGALSLELQRELAIPYTPWYHFIFLSELPNSGGI